MNRRLKWLAVAGVAATIGAAIGALVATGVSWVSEQPRLKDTPASYLQVQQGSSQYIAVPQLQDLPPPVWVRSTIESADREYTLTSPVFMLSSHQNYEIAVPANLRKGVYTVSVVVGYKMNPVRYVEQSLVIALLIIEGGDGHAISGNSKPASTDRHTSTGSKPADAG